MVEAGGAGDSSSGTGGQGSSYRGRSTDGRGFCNASGAYNDVAGGLGGGLVVVFARKMDGNGSIVANGINGTARWATPNGGGGPRSACRRWRRRRFLPSYLRR